MIRPFRKACYCCPVLIILLAVSLLPLDVSALQVWPDAEISLMAADKGLYRGLLITDEPGYGASLSIGLEPFSVDLAWMGYSGSRDLMSVDERFSYRFHYLLADKLVTLSLGLAGDVFGSPMDPQLEDSHEIVLSLTRDLRCLRGVSLKCNVSADLEQDMASYVSLACNGTMMLSDSIDLDYEVKGGVGDSGFAEAHTAHLGANISESWSDAAVSLSLPVMLGSIDLVPSISHSWVLDGGARSSLLMAGVDSESWLVGLRIVVYLD